jgi:hypothetical protein
VIVGHHGGRVVAGVAATVQNYRAAAEETTAGRLSRAGSRRWSDAGSAGALLIGAIPRSSAAAGTAGVSPETLATLPALGIDNFQFDNQELRVKAGELVALRLENRDDREHNFDIDELNVHVPIGISLAILGGLLGLSILASLLFPPAAEKDEPAS